MSVSTASGAPATYKQPSRKGKKAWRKNVDVTEIHEGLEELRSEVITGGVISEKPNEQLFSLDTVGDKGILKREQLLEKKKQKVLKVDEILNSRSAVPALTSRKRGGDVMMVTDGIVPEKKQRQKKDWVSRKDLQKLKRIAYSGGGDAVVSKRPAGELHDPWAEPEESPSSEVISHTGKKLSFLEKQKEIKAPVTLKMAPVSLAANGAQLPAVKIPQGGISYNPHFEEWDALLRKEGEREVEAERKRLKEEEEERERVARMEKEDEEERAKELELLAKGEEEEEEEKDDEGEKKEDFVKKRPTRKSKKQRLKLKKKREEEIRQASLLQQKKQRQQLESLRVIKREIEQKEVARVEALVVAEEQAGDPEKAEQLRKRKLGKAHLPPKPLELQLPEELADSLRRLKPEGNLLKDRYRSLMERGILETRVMPVIAKKRKVTETEKWSYKDFQ